MACGSIGVVPNDFYVLVLLFEFGKSMKIIKSGFLYEWKDTVEPRFYGCEGDNGKNAGLEGKCRLMVSSARKNCRNLFFIKKIMWIEKIKYFQVYISCCVDIDGFGLSMSSYKRHDQTIVFEKT